MKRTTRQIVLHWFLSILNARRSRPNTAKEESLFAELSLGFSDPQTLCMELSEKLSLPDIPSNYRRQIPTTLDTQDPPIPPMNRSARLDLTVGQFADKIAIWITHTLR